MKLKNLMDYHTDDVGNCYLPAFAIFITTILGSLTATTANLAYHDYHQKQAVKQLCVEIGFKPGTVVQSKNDIGLLTVPHKDIGVIMDIKPNGKILVDWREQGLVSTKLDNVTFTGDSYENLATN